MEMSKTVEQTYKELLDSLDRVQLMSIMSDPETCRLCADYDETHTDSIGKLAIQKIQTVIKSLE